MAKHRIVVEIDHHEATKGLSRVLRLLDFCKDSYGVTSLEYTVEDPAEDDPEEETETDG